MEPRISMLLDSDMEQDNPHIDENSLISSVSDTTSIAQVKEAKKPRKRATVGMPKKSRAKVDAAEPKPKRVAKCTAAKRKVFEAEEGEGETNDELVEVQPPKARGATTKAATARKVTEQSESKKPVRRKQTKKELGEDDVVEEELVQSNFAQTKPRLAPRPVPAAKTKSAARKATKATSASIEEHVSDLEDEAEDDIVAQQPPRKRVRTDSRLGPGPAYRRRAGSVSDTERGDPMLRRKLGDITRKYENMDVKYQHLKTVAVDEANQKVEKMRRQCEAITEASEKLVASLKQQITAQAPLVQESRKLKKEAQTQDNEMSRLRKANSDLSSTLAAAHSEIKVLQTKLAQAKAVPTPAEPRPQPAIAKAVVPTKAAVAANAEAERQAQLKIDLYGDLTGLIIRSVKQTDDGDTYDCIQTGRNGTLHFKLFVDQENAKKVSFEETEFLYTPLLDGNRDRDLLEIMPDYLTEDITFERAVAAKFYARVVKTLTERTDME